MKRKRREENSRGDSPDLQEGGQKKEDPRVTVRIANQKKMIYKKMKMKRKGRREWSR
jgi:hypothetical protein